MARRREDPRHSPDPRPEDVSVVGGGWPIDVDDLLDDVGFQGFDEVLVGQPEDAVSCSGAHGILEGRSTATET